MKKLIEKIKAKFIKKQLKAFAIFCVSISCRHSYNYKILFDHTAVAVCSKCKKIVKA